MSTKSQLRKRQLKQLLERGDHIRSSLGQQDVSETLQQIHEVVTACNDIIAEGDVKERREHTTEVVMDAQVVKMNHELVCKVFERSSEFNDQMYIAALEGMLRKDDELDWNELSNLAVSMIRCCRVKSTMCGAIETERKERSVKQRQSRAQTEKEERPELVTNLQRRDKGAEKINEVHKQVALLFRKHNVRAMPFYMLVIDPQNFMNTVENAFQLAFLVRDNIMGLRTGTDGYPEAWLISSDEPRTQNSSKQNELMLTADICAHMIQYYNLREPMLNLDLN